MMYASSVVIMLTLLVGGSDAFLSSSKEKNKIPKELRMSFNRQQADSDSNNGLSRRGLFGFALVAPCILASEPATADDRLFKPNPLTNSIFEQIRIWEQVEADNIKYDGELEMGDTGNKGKVEAYPRLLVPILKIDQELREVNSLVHENDRTSALPMALKILQDGKFEKIAFKKVFNAYSDNIYYSDPDRANAYLGGGATPKNEQSIAYLLRNDVLTNVEALTAEVEYLLKTPEEGPEDLFTYADIASSAMKKYLAIVPPNELEAAQKMLASN